MLVCVVCKYKSRVLQKQSKHHTDNFLKQEQECFIQLYWIEESEQDDIHVDHNQLEDPLPFRIKYKW